MGNRLISVPEEFVASTIAREGAAGRRWIAALPGLVETFCRRWDLMVDGPAMHGYLGLAVPVQRAGEPCVLKIAWPGEHVADEAAALAAWNGRGAVRLLAAEASQGAVLLERLDHRRTLQTVSVTEAIAVSGRLLRRLSIPAQIDVRSQQSMAEEIYQTIPGAWEQLGRPFSERLLVQTHELAGQLRRSAAKLLVNHDLFYDNTLAGTREPWLVIDPKVVIGDPEFAPALLLWGRVEEMPANRGLDYHFRLLVETAELDPALTRAWCLVRTVDYWLWALGAGLTNDPIRCQTTVEWLSSRFE